MNDDKIEEKYQTNWKDDLKFFLISLLIGGTLALGVGITSTQGEIGEDTPDIEFSESSVPDVTVTTTADAYNNTSVILEVTIPNQTTVQASQLHIRTTTAFTTTSTQNSSTHISWAQATGSNGTIESGEVVRLIPPNQLKFNSIGIAVTWINPETDTEHELSLDLVGQTVKSN